MHQRIKILQRQMALSLASETESGIETVDLRTSNNTMRAMYARERFSSRGELSL